MKTVSASEARALLDDLIDKTAETHTPVVIRGEGNRAVLVSLEDWASIQATLQLFSVPGMAESIQQGIDTPLEQCDIEVCWPVFSRAEARTGEHIDAEEVLDELDGMLAEAERKACR